MMDILFQIKNLLKTALAHTDKAYLYGSRARGDARENSDWDILIILDKDKLQDRDYDTVSYPLTSLGWDINQIINPVLYTKKEWLSQSFTPFYQNVERDKKILL